MSESYQKSVEKMQSLGESLEEINKLRQNPELVCDRTELMALTQRMEELCNEVDSCRKDFDEIKTLTSDEKAESVAKMKECESELTEAQGRITGLKNSIPDLEREIRECEQQIGTLETTLEAGVKLNKERTSEGEAYSELSFLSGFSALVAVIAGPVLPFVVIPLSLGSAVVTGIVAYDKFQLKPADIDDIKNRIQSQKDKKDSYQNQIISDKQSIESNQRDIDKLKVQIPECQIKSFKCHEMVTVLISFKKPLLHWLQFLQDLTLKMNRLQNAFGGDLAVKDSVAYREYIKFMNGSSANKSLKLAKNMRQITSMDPLDIILSLQFDD